MAITLWRRNKPFEDLMRFWEDMDSWFDFDFPRFGFEGSWTPAVDIEEKDGKYIVKADVPGVNKEDLHVELRNGYLTLKGVRKTEHEDRDKKNGFYRLERAYGSFERTFRVPEGITEKDIKAKYQDGVLELSIALPKEEGKKAIEVKVE
jgi:HSP20 family protein